MLCCPNCGYGIVPSDYECDHCGWELGFSTHSPEPQWWVCCMNGGGHFMVQSEVAPEGVIEGANFTIAAGSYRVVYGPCTSAEGEQYMDDVSGGESR